MPHCDYSGGGHRCPGCGAFCTCRYEWRGPSYTEVAVCYNCGHNTRGDDT